MTFSVAQSYAKTRALVDAATASNDTLPPESLIAKGVSALPAILPTNGLGEEKTEIHLLQDIVPGFNGSKTSANYYGFVTGGVFPIAEVADNIVTAFDQNVQVHLPAQSIATMVEAQALSMLVSLLNPPSKKKELSPNGEGEGAQFRGRTFTTGATASNILGLACGREAIISRRLPPLERSLGVSELGLLTACARAGITEIQVLTTLPHSSLAKACSLVGIGHASIKCLPLSTREPWRLDTYQLETTLAHAEEHGIASIVALSAGEVNTGRFATSLATEMHAVRALCDRYGAWLHVDGAFGIFARCLPRTPEFQTLHDGVAGLELADSITGDAHKMLNVPYDCGFFLARDARVLEQVCRNPNAAYLAAGGRGDTVPNPLNIGIENSRRFRALPVYAVLLAYGRAGLADVFVAQVRLARAIARYLCESESYELLTRGEDGEDGDEGHTHVVVLFRAKNKEVNEGLVERINRTRKMYVGGTVWEGSAAVRIAVARWRGSERWERDLEVVKEVLEGALEK